MNVTILRQVQLLRHGGERFPRRYQWGCQIHSTQQDLDVRIGAPAGLGDAGLDEPGGLLHAGLLEQIPPLLHPSARSEVGVVLTETQISGRPASRRYQSYALATCADVVVTLTGQLSAAAAAPWRGTCPAEEIDPELPVVLGPSAVLSLTAGVLEMPEEPERAEAPEQAVPEWLSVRPVSRSPYPPHEAPPDIEEVPGGQRAAITYWAARTEHWMRPMRTTRASRGQYEVHAALPLLPVGPALWVEALVSLDTRGRYWQASLSAGHSGARRWLTQPWRVEASAGDLLAAAVGLAGPSQPALDRDPVDGESFGWAPTLLTGCTARMLGLRRSR